MRRFEHLGKVEGVFEARLQRDFLERGAGLLQQPGRLVQAQFFQIPLRARSRKTPEQPREMRRGNMAVPCRLCDSPEAGIAGLEEPFAPFKGPVGGRCAGGAALGPGLQVNATCQKQRKGSARRLVKFEQAINCSNNAARLPCPAFPKTMPPRNPAWRRSAAAPPPSISRKYFPCGPGPAACTVQGEPGPYRKTPPAPTLRDGPRPARTTQSPESINSIAW